MQHGDKINNRLTAKALYFLKHTMKTNSTDKSLESVIYSLIRVTDCDSKSDLNLKVGQFATELYDEKRQELESALGLTLSKEAWIKLAQRMTFLDECYDGLAYVSICAKGILERNHEQVVDLLAIKLMSKAPDGTKALKVVTPKDESPTLYSHLIAGCSQLIPAEEDYALVRIFQGILGTTV